MGKKHAFTLSEILITLGVIGVVAAMTLPSVIQHFKEQRTVAQLSKTYSVLSQAWQRMEQEYGTIDTWGLKITNTGKTDSEGNTITNNSAQLLVAERLKPYLKVMKSGYEGEVYYNHGTYSLSGYQISPPGNKVRNQVAPASFYLSDGSFISIGWWSSGKMDICIILKPNEKGVYGENIFYFNGYPNRIVPEGSQTGSKFSFSYCKKTVSGQYAGRGCTAWVLYNKNMDYLHCNDLSWNGKTTCK